MLRDTETFRETVGGKEEVAEEKKGEISRNRGQGQKEREKGALLKSNQNANWVKYPLYEERNPFFATLVLITHHILRC